MGVYIQEDGIIKTSQSVKHIYYFRANLNININVIIFSLVKCLSSNCTKVATVTCCQVSSAKVNVYC